MRYFKLEPIFIGSRSFVSQSTGSRRTIGCNKMVHLRGCCMGGSQGYESVANGAVRVAGVLPRVGRSPPPGADIQGAPALVCCRRALQARAACAQSRCHLHKARAQFPRRALARSERPEESLQRRLRETPQRTSALFHAQSRRLPTIR